MTLPVLSDLVCVLNVFWDCNTTPINKILHLQYIEINSENVEQ